MVVLDIEMPKSCGKCPCLSVCVENGAYCKLLDRDINGFNNEFDTWEVNLRQKDCPLKPLPKCKCGAINYKELFDQVSVNALKAIGELQDLR